MGSLDRPTKWEQVAAWDMLGVKSRRDEQCTHGLEKTQRGFSSQPATCSPGRLISQKKKKATLLPTGQKHG